MLFKTKQKYVVINDFRLSFLDSSPLENTEKFKYLGVWLDSDLSFKSHVQNLSQKINFRLRNLYQSIDCFTLKVREKIASQLILPILDYADVVYQNTNSCNLNPLNVAYNSICRFILRCPYRTHHCLMYQQLSWLTLPARRKYHWYLFIFKCIYFNLPLYLKQHFTQFSSSYNLRHNESLFFNVPRVKKEVGRNAFGFGAPHDWNELPVAIRSITSFPLFKNAILDHLQLLTTILDLDFCFCLCQKWSMGTMQYNAILTNETVLGFCKKSWLSSSILY